MSHQQKLTAVGAADNVDLRERDPTTPFDRDVDQHRVIDCYCCHCGISDTVLAEPGRTREWSHAERHPRHVIDYHVEETSR